MNSTRFITGIRDFLSISISPCLIPSSHAGQVVMIRSAFVFMNFSALDFAIFLEISRFFNANFPENPQHLSKSSASSYSAFSMLFMIEIKSKSSWQGLCAVIFKGFFETIFLSFKNSRTFTVFCASFSDFSQGKYFAYSLSAKLHDAQSVSTKS